MDGAHKGHAFFAYAANYLIDADHGVIVDDEATRAIRQAEVGAARTMLERIEDRFGLKPDYLTADSAYGSALKLPIIVATTARDSMWRPTFPELVEASPGIEIIDRSSVNAFDDARIAHAIEATGRKKLIFAGDRRG